MTIPEICGTVLQYPFEQPPAHKQSGFLRKKHRDQVIQQYTYGASVSVSEWGNKALSSKDLKIPKLEKGVFSSPTAMG